MAHELVVVDYHKGNLLSVARSLSAVGAEVAVSDDPRTIAEARGIVLPGVGSFEDAMSHMRSSGQADAVVGSVRRGTPFLGICLGLQLLFGRGSECTTKAWGNGWVPGLGLLPGSVTRLESSRLKVPHVGWNQLHLTAVGRRCPLLVDVSEGSNVYFTHSYALADDVGDPTVATRTHYTRTFGSTVWQDNVFGVQFHPEKSSATGLRILGNFVRYVRG
ncbi:MAG: imidazole glycerol phosphate synthase subunit HisH [Acidobacteriota bacterium]|nr:imidazole glycerol phosphate synthase subunit HisH [Acidobacteriota bacterium]